MITDMVGAHQNLNGSRDVIMHLSGMVCYPWASTGYNQLIHWIWSLYISTHYKDIEATENVENGVVWGS